jgi:hypothetical protein
MKGLDLAEAYFREVGLPMIRERFADCADRLAAGMVGPGSECFGFDDELSRDHDWGPAFCLWLSEDDYARFVIELQAAYSGLPPVFDGFGPRRASPGEEWRVGIARTAAFYRRFTGLDRPPERLEEWLRIPEESLATCTNGRVFHDPLGEFSGRRRALLAYYPEDIRLKKIASLCITVAQSGQYNYLRSVQRADRFATAYSAITFAANAIRMVFLLNRRFAPFYKWLHRGVLDLPVLGSEVHEQTDRLLVEDHAERKADLMESVSVRLAEALREQGLSDSESDFLLDHAPQVQARIESPRLRQHLKA